LRRAMEQAREKVPKIAPLRHCLQTTTALNQRELCGLLLYVFKLNVHRAEHRSMVVDIMRCLSRLDMKKEFKTEMALMAVKWNQVLCLEHAAAKKKMVGASAWLSAYAGTWELVLPIGEVQTLLALESDSTWLAAEQELLTVVSSGQLGCQLFGFAVGDLLCNSVDAIMMLASEDVLGLSEFTEEAVRKMQTKHGDSLDELPHVELMKQRRCVKIMYRGIALDVEVGCIFDELSLHIQSAVRTVAVDSERLAPLAGELDMVPLNEDNNDKDVDETLIAGSANAERAGDQAAVGFWRYRREVHGAVGEGAKGSP